MSSAFTVVLVMLSHVELCALCGRTRDSLELNEKMVMTGSCGFQGADVLFLWLFSSPSPSCFGVPSSQMDAVRQLNDACFPSLALAAAAVYMQSRRQTSCKTHVLIYVGALRNYTNITLLTAHIDAPTTCNERHFI